MHRKVALVIAGLAGAAVAVLAGIAVAKSFTLNVAHNAKVIDFVTHAVTHENIAVTGGGGAVYWLSGDTTSHPRCTQANGCFKFWPPVTANKPTKAAGISGKLRAFHRDGMSQVTLGGHPLYTFAPDKGMRDVANGEDVHGFGGVWHVVRAASSNKAANAPAPAQTTTTSSTPYPAGW